MSKGPLVKSLFVQYGTELKRYVAHKFGDSNDADDIVQDAFHNLLKSKSPEELENPRAYLYQTAHNLALNRIRKQRYADNYAALEHSEEDARSPERFAGAQADLEQVESALSNLPDKCRQAFIMHRMNASSYQEIADELKVSVSSVEKYLMRAMKFLRENFDGNG